MSVLAAARVVTGEEVHAPGWIAYDAGRITAVGPGRPAHVTHHLGDATVVPGFVDLHVHGGGGGSFTDPDVSSALRALDTHRRHGTTTTMASLVTASPEELLASVAMLAELYEDQLIAGIHLEGPWISPNQCGAHDPTQLRHPDPAELARLLAAGRGAIRMVTLAPELPGALDTIRQVVDAGAVAAIGHTDADYDHVALALDAGARVATHLFNAMRPLHHRHPGPIVALLEDRRVIVELIADGIHLHPALYRLACAAAPDRVALVTDAMAAAALGDGSYQLGRLAVTADHGVARLTGTETIAGSTTTTDRLFGAAATTRPDPHAAPAEIATSGLLRAARQSSTIPARALGRTDIGVLAPGRRADLVVLDSNLTVIAVMCDGRWHQNASRFR